MVRAALLLAIVAGCTPEGDDTATACTSNDQLVDWETWGAGFFADYCRTCHSAGTPDRHGAPDAVNFDTAAEVATLKDAIRQSVLVDESMPVGGGVPDADLAELDTFLSCGL